MGERERERPGRKRRSDRGEREKITNTKKFVEFYLVVLHSAERSEARQCIVARQVSYYNPLSCFNPVTYTKLTFRLIDTNCQLTNLGSILRKNIQRPKLLRIP